MIVVVIVVVMVVVVQDVWGWKRKLNMVVILK